MKVKAVSLEGHFKQQIGIVILLVFFSILIILYAVSLFQKSLDQRRALEELHSSHTRQLVAILPSFFIPEQSSGLSLLLEEFRSEENLSDIRVLSGKELTSELSHWRCRDEGEAKLCHNSTDEIAHLSPIREGDVHFGYLMKVRKIKSGGIGNRLAMGIWVLGAGLMASLLGLIWITMRLTNRDIPASVNALMSKLRLSLSGDSRHQEGQFRYVEFEDLAREIEKLVKENQDARKQMLLSEMAGQVAHDIRSPLEVLKTLRGELSVLPEESRRVVQMSINRIEEIAYNLLKAHKMVQTEEIHSEELQSLIKSVVVEKSIEYRGSFASIVHRIQAPQLAAFSPVRRGNLKRVLSNLINNGVEALEGGRGEVVVSLREEEGENVITVEDSGVGMSEEVKARLFEKNFTTKPDGNGIGLSSAREEITFLGGKIEVESAPGMGTKFSLRLPKCGPSAIHVESIDLTDYERIIVLDDDPTFHEVWKAKMSSYNKDLVHFYSIPQMLERFPELPKGSLLLSDYELQDEKLDGLDLIRHYGRPQDSLLVTARSEEHLIQSRCQELGVRLLPKEMAPLIPIRCGSPSVVLIDDEKLVHLNWSYFFKQQGIPFKSFFCVEDFLAAHGQLDPDAWIFIDSNLRDGQKGEVESERIYRQGFERIVLATGAQASQIMAPAWIKGVVGKGPQEALGFI